MNILKVKWLRLYEDRYMRMSENDKKIIMIKSDYLRDKGYALMY